jgi:UPF0716 protein FxsA
MWLFLVFVTVPIIEIALFIQVGGWIGLWPTLAIVILTAVAGTMLVRVQGLQTLARLQSSLVEGGDPVSPIAHGALILVAGVLLLTPGFFTDAMGLALLIPAVRARLIRWGAARVTVQAAGFARAQGRGGPGAGSGSEPQHDVEIIEAEYEVIEEPEGRPRRGGSGWTRPEG